MSASGVLSRPAGCWRFFLIDSGSTGLMEGLGLKQGMAQNIYGSTTMDVPELPQAFDPASAFFSNSLYGGLAERGKEAGKMGERGEKVQPPSEPPPPPGRTASSEWRVGAPPPPDSRKRSRSRRRDKDRGESERDSRTSRSRAGSSRHVPDPIELGQTSGVTAAGAWAARWGVASLLESRCGPAHLVSLDAGKSRSAGRAFLMSCSPSRRGSTKEEEVAEPVLESGCSKSEGLGGHGES